MKSDGLTLALFAAVGYFAYQWYKGSSAAAATLPVGGSGSANPALGLQTSANSMIEYSPIPFAVAFPGFYWNGSKIVPVDGTPVVGGVMPPEGSTGPVQGRMPPVPMPQITPAQLGLNGYQFRRKPVY